MRVSEVLTEMSKEDRPAVTGGLVNLFGKYNISVVPVLTRHFQDRLWAREKSILPQEVISAFSRALEQYHQQISNELAATGKFAGVIKDYASNINIVFTIENPVETDSGDKYRLYGITIMRKRPDQFIARNGEVLVIESGGYDVSANKPRIHRKKHFKWKSSKKGQTQLIKRLWMYANADAT